MTRTVLLACPYFPPHAGGVETYVCQLARHLRARHGYRVLVATTADRHTPPGYHRGPDGIGVYRLPAPARISNTPLSLGWPRRLRQLITSQDVDLVNGHAPAPFFADAAARTGTDVPFVLTYHTGRMRRGNLLTDLPLAGYERTVLAGTVRRARELICCSDYVVADQPRLFANATVICPGVDLSCFTPQPVPATPRLLFVGSLEPATAYKGLGDLLNAVALLRHRRPAVELEVVGTGAAQGSYAATAARLGIADRVTFRGRLEAPALAEAYRSARVLALPSSFESFGSVLAEAMACGRPVVATPVGGIPSLVFDHVNGLLVPPGDVTALSSALAQLLDDDALARRLGAAGHAHVAAELSWEQQADRTAEVFARALDGRQC